MRQPKDRYKSDYLLKSERSELQDCWMDQHVLRRWNAEDRIREINDELRSRRNEEMEREENYKRTQFEQHQAVLKEKQRMAEEEYYAQRKSQEDEEPQLEES
jgi:hypothetical protein